MPGVQAPRHGHGLHAHARAAREVAQHRRDEAALVAGLTNLTAYGKDCGSAFGPAGLGISRSVADFFVENACESAVQGRRALALVLIALGAIGVAIGARLLAATPRRTAAANVADDLARLLELRSAGALTDDEYAAARARVLRTEQP